MASPARWCWTGVDASRGPSERSPVNSNRRLLLPAARIGRGVRYAGVALGLALAIAHARSPEALYRDCLAACAEVLVDGRHAGVAWLADERGAALTAGHLFQRRSPRVELLFADNRQLPARLVAVDRGHDLALLQVQLDGQGRRPLLLARRAPTVGETLFHFGAPIFRAALLQPGRVAGSDTRFEFDAFLTDYAEVMPVAALMQGGTSGGPWLDRRGRVVGVQSRTVSLDGQPVGLAFFAPVSAVRRLLETRREADTPTLGLGVDELWQQPLEYLRQIPARTRGLVVAVVRESGPAAGAGLQVRDVLLEADAQPLVRIADLLRVVRRHRPGDRLELTFLRPGAREVRRVPVVLARAEDLWLPDGPSDSEPLSRP